MFVCAIVVTCNGTGADINVIANLSIAKVGQMTGLRAFTQTRFFHFDKVTHVRAFLQLSTRAQTCEWTNGASGFQMGIFHHTVWAKLTTFTNHAVFDDTASTNFNMVAQLAITFDDDIDINLYILTDS